MSELTLCCHCSLKAIRARAEERGLTVTLMADTSSFGGTNVYVHPPNVDVTRLLAVIRKNYFAAWMMQITKTCAC